MSGLSQQNANKDDDSAEINTPDVKIVTKKKRKSNEDMQEGDTKSVKLRNTKRKKSESPNRETILDEHTPDRLCQTTSTAFDNRVSSALTMSNNRKPSLSMESLPNNTSISDASVSSFDNTTYDISDDISSEDEESNYLKINVRKSKATTNLTQEAATSMWEEPNQVGPRQCMSAIKQEGIKMINQEKFEEELKCSICSEIFIKAVTLNCSHSFCKFCIMKWRKDHTTCPICRQGILNQNSTLVLDKCVERVLECYEEDALKRRQEIVDFRDKNGEPDNQNGGLNEDDLQTELEQNFSLSDYSEETNSLLDEYFDYHDFEWEDEVYSPPSYASDDYGDFVEDIDAEIENALESETEQEVQSDDGEEEDNGSVLDQLSGEEDYCEEDDDDDDDPNSDEDDISNRCFNCGEIGHMARYCPTAVAYTGTPGAYFGGYGSCFKCDQPGHWANGCPN